MPCGTMLTEYSLQAFVLVHRHIRHVSLPLTMWPWSGARWRREQCSTFSNRCCILLDRWRVALCVVRCGQRICAEDWNDRVLDVATEGNTGRYISDNVKSQGCTRSGFSSLKTTKSTSIRIRLVLRRIDIGCHLDAIYQRGYFKAVDTSGFWCQMHTQNGRALRAPLLRHMINWCGKVQLWNEG